MASGFVAAGKRDLHAYANVGCTHALGKRGGEALMTAVTRSQTAERFISLSLRNCDLEFLDTSASAFNPMEPTVRTQLGISRHHSSPKQ